MEYFFKITSHGNPVNYLHFDYTGEHQSQLQKVSEK